MALTVAGTRNGLTALQLDVYTTGAVWSPAACTASGTHFASSGRHCACACVVNEFNIVHMPKRLHPIAASLNIPATCGPRRQCGDAERGPAPRQDGAASAAGRHGGDAARRAWRSGAPGLCQLPSTPRLSGAWSPRDTACVKITPSCDPKRCEHTLQQRHTGRRTCRHAVQHIGLNTLPCWRDLQAPMWGSVSIDRELIGRLIGPKGSSIQALEASTGARLAIFDDAGSVQAR